MHENVVWSYELLLYFCLHFMFCNMHLMVILKRHPRKNKNKCVNVIFSVVLSPVLMSMLSFSLYSTLRVKYQNNLTQNTFPEYNVYSWVLWVTIMLLVFGHIYLIFTAKRCSSCEKQISILLCHMHTLNVLLVVFNVFVQNRF